MEGGIVVANGPPKKVMKAKDSVTEHISQADVQSNLHLKEPLQMENGWK